jgi:hypothetical protein
MRPVAEINTLNTQLAANGEPSQPRRSFEQDATRVLGRLQHALADLLAGAPEEIRKAADVERIFGIDHRLGWQVYRIATSSHPLSAGINVPARVSVDRLVKVAARKGVSPAVVAEVTLAFDGFEELVKQHAGSRTDFDVLVGSALPEHQERIGVSARESMYQAARTIRGAAMDTSHITHMLHPSASDPDRLDGLHLSGNYGLHRIRHGATIQTPLVYRDPAKSNLRSVAGDALTDSTDVLLHRFCSDPMPKIRVHKGEGQVRFLLEVEDVGARAAVDSVFGVFMPAYRSRFAVPGVPLAGVAHETDAPAHWQVIDMLVYDGVIPFPEPTATVYDMVPHGQLASIPDPDRDLDRVAFQPKVRSLGQGLEGFRCLHIPRYQEMLEFVCASRGWKVSRFHGFRVEIEYPVYSWQTVLALALPQRPQ